MDDANWMSIGLQFNYRDWPDRERFVYLDRLCLTPWCEVPQNKIPVDWENVAPPHDYHSQCRQFAPVTLFRRKVRAPKTSRMERNEDWMRRRQA